jgi:hypothetical protein
MIEGEIHLFTFSKILNHLHGTKKQVHGTMALWCVRYIILQ